MVQRESTFAKEALRYGLIMIVLGFIVFHELPDVWTWVGAAVIIASGLYIGYRESIRRRLARS